MLTSCPRDVLTCHCIVSNQAKNTYGAVNRGAYLDSAPCKHLLITARRGGKFEVMLEFNFNEQTKALPLNLLYFLPNDNQLKDSLSAALSTSLPAFLTLFFLFHSVIYYAGLI